MNKEINVDLEETFETDEYIRYRYTFQSLAIFKLIRIPVQIEERINININK